MPKFTLHQIIDILKSWKKKSSAGARQQITIPCPKKMNWKIADWMQGKLSEKEDRVLTEHLRECWVCREWLSQYKSYNPGQKKVPGVVKPGLIKWPASLLRLPSKNALARLRHKWQFVTGLFATPLRASLSTAAVIMVLVLSFFALGGPGLFSKKGQPELSFYGETKGELFQSKLWEGIEEADIYQFKLFEEENLIWGKTTRERIFPSGMPPLVENKKYKLRIEALTNKEIVSSKEFIIKLLIEEILIREK